MVITNEEIASKIEYLKDNHYMPNIDNETLDVQNVIRSFYYNTKIHHTYDSDYSFWFSLTFCNYQVSDKFVREVNREYKRFQIKNIAVKEFDN